MAKIIQDTKHTTITDDGLMRIDGVTTFRKVIRDGIIFVQFCDRDKMRSQCRGTKFIEIPLALLVEILTMDSERKENEPTNTKTE